MTMSYSAPLPLTIHTITTHLYNRQYYAMGSYLLENYSPDYNMEMNEFETEVFVGYKFGIGINEAAREEIAKGLAAIVWLDEMLTK